jgi:adenylate cyclase
MWPMAIDFAAEGLLDGAPDERARQARLELLRSLESEGFGLDELRRAATEGRLALLPVERVLAAEGPRYAQEEIAAETGLDHAFLAEARRAVGAPQVEAAERVLTEEDRELALSAVALLNAGLAPESFFELIRVMSQAMASVAACFTSIWGEALLQPGDTERDLGLRYAESLRNLGPLAGPALQHMLNLRMREAIRQAVVTQAELQSGHLPGSQPVTVGFVDIVGFTELGEEVPPEELGAMVRGFERTVEDAARAPVRLVKTIGDAAMLVAPEPGPGGGDARPRGGLARERGAPAAARRHRLRRSAAASRRLVRAAGQPRLPSDRVRAPGQRRGFQGSARRGARRPLVVLRRPPAPQGSQRRGRGLPGAPAGLV